MREIKFRVWCKERDQLVNIRKIYFDDGELSCVEDCDGEVYFPERDDWELMQTTGLKYENPELFEREAE